MPRRPSEVLQLGKRGISDEACLDFDLALVWFDGWVREKQGEQVWGAPDDTHRGQVQRPKYQSLDQILELYAMEADPDARFSHEGDLMDSTEIASIIASIASEPSF